MKPRPIRSADFGASVALLPLSDFLDPDVFDDQARYSPLDTELSISTRLLTFLCAIGLITQQERVASLGVETIKSFGNSSVLIPAHRVALPSGQVVTLTGTTKRRS